MSAAFTMCVVVLGILCISHGVVAQVPEWVVYPGGEWQTLTPEEAGITDLAAWSRWLAATTGKAHGGASFGEDHTGNKWGVAITRGGYLIQTFGDPDYKYQTASVGKTFSIACLQLAVDHGIIESADDLISKYWTGEGELNAPHKYLNRGHHQTLTFQHL